MPNITRALISVSDKTGVVEFARDLAEAGVESIRLGTKELSFHPKRFDEAFLSMGRQNRLCSRCRKRQ